MMKIMVVEPGHSHSTKDVYTGLCAGLTACGADVIGYPLEGALAVTQGLHALAKEHAPDLAAAFDPISAAAHAIIGRAVWRQVDAVIAVTGQNLHFGAVGTLRKAGILTAMLCTEAPYLTLERERYDAAHYDIIFTNDKSAVGLYDKPAVYLPSAYNPDVHTIDGPRAPDCDVFFVGTGFSERHALVNAIDWSGIDLRLAGALWGEHVQLMDNAEATSHYRAAAICLNHHRTTRDYGSGQHIDAAYSLGPRAYEIAACGGFQIMDESRAEAREVFGDTLVTYADAADLETKLRWWLSHPIERAATAAAQHQAIQRHTWTARAGAVLDVISQEHSTWQPSTA